MRQEQSEGWRTAAEQGWNTGEERGSPRRGVRGVGSVGSCVAGCYGSGATVLLRPPVVDFRGCRAAYLRERTNPIRAPARETKKRGSEEGRARERERQTEGGRKRVEEGGCASAQRTPLSICIARP